MFVVGSRKMLGNNRALGITSKRIELGWGLVGPLIPGHAGSSKIESDKELV